MTEWVKPIGLPEKMEETPAGTECIVTGWGATYEGQLFLPDDLQKVSIPVVGDEECDQAYDPNYDVAESMICAGVLGDGGKDSCQGDSGGPFIDANRTKLLGIVSWGIGCAREEYPGVYTQVSYFVDWLEEKMAM